ncbi:ABC transporter ATP-binding protein [Cupriavidus pauculus]|uniref:ABC transporter ATP-binding protein n=2 Tax=Burkholderiaceae TaxID=119060 RepID=A0A5P2HF01_9BURK|nr:ABC transporter ATP-binding protein [Cupriavidus pauculus]
MAQPIAPLLRTDAVSLSYAGRDIFAGIDLALHAGEIVSIIGPSGAGKSSLLRVLAGLQAGSSGHVRMGDAALTGPHPDIAVAFQDACLLPWLSVEHNAAFGLDFRRQPATTRKERHERVARMLDAVGLSHAKHLFPAQISGGMAQRVALARCMARQPRVLLLDEPFGALDEITRADMQTLLRDIVRIHRPATLLITHDLDEALLLSDRIILLGAHAGEPARIAHTWHVTLPHPREAQVEAMGALRVDLVRRLRELVQTGGPRAVTSPSSIHPNEGNHVPGTNVPA